MKKIKVALLIDEFFGGADTAYGGYGFLARHYISKYLPNENLQLDVILEMKNGLKEPERVKVDNVYVYRLPNDKKIVAAWLKNQNYDIFFSIELTIPSYNILKYSGDRRKKLVLWIQDPRPKSAWINIIESMASIKDPSFFCDDSRKFVHFLTRCGAVEYISQGKSLIPLAQELYDIPEGIPVRYVPNPIEIDEDFIFNKNNKRRKIVFLGRLEAQKRAWLFCEIAKRMPQYDFFVMGKFFRHKKENERMLRQYMEGEIPNLHFVGHLEGKEKEALLWEARILVNTSIWEGIPISWLECLQYGTLIVSCFDRENLVSRFGIYVGEVLGDGLDAVDRFIQAIEELMTNDEKYILKANAAIQYIRENHTVKKFQDDLRSILFQAAQPLPASCFINIKYEIYKFLSRFKKSIAKRFHGTRV